MKDCSNCAYATETGCEVFKDRQANCGAWADETEKQRREQAIEDYFKNASLDNSEKYVTTMDKNAEKRNGLTVKQALRKDFMRLYGEGLNDCEISNEIHVCIASVRLYRREKGLEKQGQCGRKKACGNRQIEK